MLKVFSVILFGALFVCSAAALAPPVWPANWNATLIKISDQKPPSTIQWTKFYYSGDKSRFDFMNSYLSLDEEWDSDFTILFTPNLYQGKTYYMIYHIYPKDKRCEIRTNMLPNISRFWLRGWNYKGQQMIKGVWVEKWQSPIEEELMYFNRVAEQDDDRTPVRSTNQANDPGATDYVDVVLGPQDQSLFSIPAYCPPPTDYDPSSNSVAGSLHFCGAMPYPFNSACQYSF
eukprot:GILI01003463.1.p2 GENE.GILI01003463.1~~GILI01003463.1.p2  ORF type:complete len:231 (-),score=57.54 GILI01003463.1:85-777(-)